MRYVGVAQRRVRGAGQPLREAVHRVPANDGQLEKILARYAPNRFEGRGGHGPRVVGEGHALGPGAVLAAGVDRAAEMIQQELQALDPARRLGRDGGGPNAQPRRRQPVIVMHQQPRPPVGLRSLAAAIDDGGEMVAGPGAFRLGELGIENVVPGGDGQRVCPHRVVATRVGRVVAEGKEPFTGRREIRGVARQGVQQGHVEDVSGPILVIDLQHVTVAGELFEGEGLEGGELLAPGLQAIELGLAGGRSRCAEAGRTSDAEKKRNGWASGLTSSLFGAAAAMVVLAMAALPQRLMQFNPRTAATMCRGKNGRKRASHLS